MKKTKRGTSKSIAAALKWEPHRQFIEWLYRDQHWSQSKLGQYFGVTQSGMGAIMRRLEIKSVGKGRAGYLNGRYKDGSESRMYRLMINKDRCSKCGAPEHLAIHHKNFDHYDNHLENLEVLCDHCHNSLHKKRWWNMKKAMEPKEKEQANGPMMAGMEE